MSDNCYDYPQYWDLAFEDETQDEADFLERVAEKYCDFPVKNLLEPGCGGGRLVVEMAKRGYQVEGFDLSSEAIQFLQTRLKQQNLSANVYVDDMTDFVAAESIDLAFNLMNTFRHLLSEEDAKSHLESVAASLRVGGIYVIGMHLLPPDADLEDEEEWDVEQDGVRVEMFLEVIAADRQSRVEVIRFELDVDDHGETRKLTTDYSMRMYLAEQFESLLESVPQFELVDVYDFCYEIDEPLELSDELGDTVFILRRVS